MSEARLASGHQAGSEMVEKFLHFPVDVDGIRLPSGLADRKGALLAKGERGAGTVPWAEGPSWSSSGYGTEAEQAGHPGTDRERGPGSGEASGAESVGQASARAGPGRGGPGSRDPSLGGGAGDR